MNVKVKVQFANDDGIVHEEEWDYDLGIPDPVEREGYEWYLESATITFVNPAGTASPEPADDLALDSTETDAALGQDYTT